MRRLTCKARFFHKRIFSFIWFGFLSVFLSVGLFANTSGQGSGIMFVVVPICMAAFGYFIMKNLVWDLIDELFDEGTTLLFQNRGSEARVSLRDIKNVSYSTKANPPRVTLSIRYKTDLGDELSLSPPASWIPFKNNKDIEELIDRIGKARG